VISLTKQTADKINHLHHLLPKHREFKEKGAIWLKKQRINCAAALTQTYCNDVECTDITFIVSNEEELKQVLFGTEQRYCTTPLRSEKRLANSVLPLETQFIGGSSELYRESPN